MTIGTRSLLWADVHNGASFKAYCGNPPDWKEMLAWRNLLQPGDIFLDVGANVGTYTLWVAELGAHVIAIEPDPDARSLLSENLLLNGLEHIEVLPIAVGATPGPMRLTRGRGANHLVLREEPDITYLEVYVNTLDNVIGDRVVGGLKIDVEGAELLVLEGAKRALAEHRIRCIQMEWNWTSFTLLGQSRDPIVELLQSYGYRLFRPDNDGNLHLIVGEIDDEAEVFAKPELVAV